jgi:hypothetical protein
MGSGGAAAGAAGSTGGTGGAAGSTGGTAGSIGGSAGAGTGGLSDAGDPDSVAPPDIVTPPPDVQLDSRDLDGCRRLPCTVPAELFAGALATAAAAPLNAAPVPERRFAASARRECAVLPALSAPKFRSAKAAPPRWKARPSRGPPTIPTRSMERSCSFPTSPREPSCHPSPTVPPAGTALP